MQEAQIVNRNLDESIAILGSSPEHKSNKDFLKVDILKELNEENEFKSTPRLRLLQEDDIICEKLAVSPVLTISSRTLSPLPVAKRLSVNVSQKADPSKISLFRQGSVENSLRSPAKSPGGFFHKGSENYRHLASGAKRIAKLRSSSTKEMPQDSYYDTAELYDIQHLFYHYEGPSINNSNGDVRKKNPLVSLSEIQGVYYNALRKKMVRRKSQKLEEPVEFSEQIKEIKGSVRTPNDMRSRDIVIRDKTKMERITNYHDTFPLLGFRKKVLQFLQWISILCYKIVTFPAFDYVILAVVLANSIMLAMDDPTDNKAAIPAGLDNTFLGIYTAEMALKILGMGFFFGKKAYLKDYWNILDFVIVTTAYIPLLVTSSSVNLQAIRVLRVLRPLRVVSKVKDLKVVMLTLLAAMRPLMETVFILIFMFAIFAIAGLQLFSGILKKRCFALDTGITMINPSGDSDINNQIFCSTDHDCEDYDGILHICGKMIANPVYGITNFDNLLSSLLMVYQTVTMEGWSAIMYDIQKTFNTFTAIYFLAVIIMCSYFLLNLTLAIIKAEFTSKSTDADKGRLDRRFLSYHVKLAEKLERKKGDVLKLIKRRENGEIKFDKYIFRKENLVALQTKKGHTKDLPRRRRRGTLGSISDKFTEFGSALSRRIKLEERDKKGLLFTVINMMKTSRKNVAVHPSPERKPHEANLQNVLSVKDQEEEALKSPKSPDDLSLSPNFPKKQEEADAAVSFEGSKANSFIVEANEQPERSIKTPTEASAHSLSDAQFAPRRRIGMRTSKSPIRPIISQKIQVSPEGKRDLIGMAGIRNKKERRRVQMEKSATGLDLLSLAEKSERNEISISEDRSVLDYPEGRHFAFSPPKGAENDDVVVSKNLVRKINKIKKLGNKINKSRASSSRKKSELLPSIFDLEEEVNYRQNEIEANIPSGILNDSDFFNDRQRYEMLRRKKANKQYKQKRGFSNGELLSPRAKKRARNIQKAGNLLSPESLDTTQIDDEAHSESEEEDKEKYVINLRHLKTSAAFNKEYETLSIDDVLPSEKERQTNQQEQEVIRQLRETRLPMKFRITQYDQARTIAQRTTRYTQSMTAASVAFQSNLTIQKIRKHKLDVKTFEDNLSKKNSGSTARTSLKRGTTKHKKKWHGNVLRHQDEEDYLPPGKEKDFFEVLKMMNKPFKNEDEFEDPEANQKKLKEFKFDDEYKSCRRKDLKNNKIASNNWSGLSVLSKSGQNFAIERAKMALNNQDFDIWRKGVLGFLHAGRRKVRAFIETSFFNNIILISVFLNTIILASQNLVTSTSGTNLLNTFNLIFTIIFTVEMCLKLIALGPKGYAKDPMNLFDCLIVILSLFDLISTASSGSSSSGNGGKKAASAFRTVRLFRTFRVLRVTRLLRSLSYMKVIIGVVSRSLKKCVWVLVLLLLFLFIFSLLGMQIYGGKLSSSADQGGLREDYNSFFDAFLSAFQLITQENWNDFMTISIRSPEINTYISLLYLISWMCLGSYVFLNLFLAILLDEFTGEETEEELEEIEEENGEEEESIGGRTSSKTTVGGRTSSRTTVGGLESTKRGTTQRTISIQSFDSKLSLDASEDDKSSAHKIHQHHQVIACRRSLYIFSNRNWIRSACLWITRHKYFERAILTMIAISSLKLSVDTFVSSSNDTYTNISDIFDKVINIFFAVEAVTKIISLGFFMDEGSYARDSWNLLDFIIVVVSLIDMSFSNLNIPAIKVLRLLRTLRPLRVVSHNPSMRLIVTALLESLKPMLNVVVVICLVWLMFAILAVNIVGLKLGYCNMNDANASYYGISESECPQYGVWTNPNVNFDNVGTAMVSLFVMSTEENWPTLMFSVADADDASSGPQKNGNKLFAGFYFMIYLFISSFFLLDLFAGVIFLEFTRAEKRENKMRKFLTSTQQQWVIMQRLVITVKADLSNVEPEAAWMKRFFRIIHHHYFDMGIMCVILLNILSICLDYDGCSDGYTNALQIANYIFSAIFAIELVLKHLGLGYRRYWASNWNRFDAFVVLASILDLVMSLLQQSFLSFLKIGPQIARIFRVLRVTRLFKLIKQFEGLQKLINTLLFSLPSLLNVGALLFLVFYIYSILGNFLFKNVATGSVIGDLVNFENAAIAFITLFRCSTGENWYIIMFDTIYPTTCVDGVSSCSTSPAVALPYWISFIILAEYIFLNLFILVILQQFEEYHLNPDNPVNRFRETIEDKFVPTWEKFSLKHGGAHIHENQLLNFFMAMEKPIGFRNSNLPKKEIAKEVMRMNLTPDPYKMLFYNDVIFAAFKHGFNSEPISEFTQYQYLLKEEMKSRKKLDGLRQIAIGHRARNAQLQTRGTIKPATVNPIEKILFMGLMMKIWKNYAKVTFAKMQAAQKNGVDYVFSDSEEEEEEEDSQQIESESENSYDDQDDESSRSQEAHSPARNDLIEEAEEEEDHQEGVLFQKGSSQIKFGLVMNEDMGRLSNLQREMADEKFYSLGPISPQTRTRRSLLPFMENKDLSGITGERNRSLSTLPPPKIFMHNAEGEIHDITPKVSVQGEKSFVNPSSKSFNDY